MCFDLTLTCPMEGREVSQEDERWWEPRHGATGQADGGGGRGAGGGADGGEAGAGAGMDMGGGVAMCIYLLTFVL